ncbi:hypothetical protein FKW77_000884 [Venturia effusa]|uniref:Ribosome biogenesis protein SLX9 n=1 Tax=Venturia effusa TaxID=50376 RepID=A0A517L4U2_9PEZI|nr:hypothetical protein FKW77_000884 [Venturia effusa]
MAPIRPTKRSGASKPQRTTFTAKSTDLFHNSKRDKREMKHSLLLSKARKSAGIAKPLKRRRPSKKLVTTMESLEDALPELEEHMVKAKTGARDVGDKNKSLGSKPGVRKKRERIEREERERFGKNLALLSMARPDNAEGGEAAGATSNRWAALRAHLNSSMAEQAAAGG